jgi:DcaP outer membrane protein
MRVVRPSALVVLATFAGTGVGHLAQAAEPARSFEIYGFAQVDYIQDTKRVNPDWQDAFRPSRIATPEGQYGSNGQASVSVKQSRFGVKGVLPTSDHQPPINFKFEFDMFGVGADAGKTTIRLRHAYGEWGQLLGGQTHSLFMDIDVFPNVIDYWGPAGMVFLRTPQIRWTAYRTANDTLAVAVEKPGNDVDPGNIRLVQGFEGAEVRPDQPVPDLTGQFRHDDNWGHYQIGVILRRVGYEYSIAGEPFQKGSQTGWGVDLSAALNTLVKDKLLLSLVYGDGIASYMNDGGMDIAPQTSPGGPINGLAIGSKAVPLTGVMAYYDHYWNSQLSSSIGYSYTQVNNTNFQDTTAFHKGQYASGNLLWYPVDNVMVGAELMWGRKTNNDGTTGDDVRIQFSAKYNFGTKL